MNTIKTLFAIILLFPSFALGDGEVGKPAPALTATEFDGTPFDLTAERGKVVLVHFWATWCVSCREEMPMIETLYKRYHAQGLDIIAVSLDRPRERDEAVKYMRDFSFPSVMQSEASVNRFDRPDALPVTYVLGRDGTVRATLRPDTRPLTEEDFTGAVLPLIEKK